MKLSINENSELFKESNNCLNCGQKLAGKYCSNCGQKSDTRRITLKNFIENDILHGTLHFEKGMLFTAKEAVIRPGKAALDYISGKRKRYYNIFLFNLLLIGLNLYLSHLYDQFYLEYFPEEANVIQNNELGNKIDEFLENYSKLIIFLFIPVSTLNSYLIFRRRKLNLSEHAIIGGMALIGILMVSVLGYLISFFDFSETFKFITFLSPYVPLLAFFYMIFVYYQAFRSEYTLIGFIYRMLIVSLLFVIEIILLFVIMLGFLSDWKFGVIKYTR